MRFSGTLALAAVFLTGSTFAAAPRILTGPDEGGAPQVNSFRPDARAAGNFDAYPTTFTGGVRVAVGNVAGVSDVVVGAGPGAAPVVRVFSGAERTPTLTFNAFDASFTGGVFVAVGDVNGDGRDDVVVGAGGGSGGHIKVIDGTTGSPLLPDLFAFDSSFNGGVRVAAGDLDGDGRADIIAGAGPGGTNGHVKVFSGKDLSLLHDFFAFTGFSGGVHVAAGDVNGDGTEDVIVGTGATTAHIKVFSGRDQAELRSFFAFPPGTPAASGGVRVAGTDLNRDGIADILAATGPGSATTINAFDGANLQSLGTVTPYGPNATHGAYVGARRRFPPVPLNIATRINVLTDDNALIGGFIVRGTEAKRVIIRGIGPSSGVTGALQDPVLELFEDGTMVASNDNWKSDQQREIEATGIPPANDAEAAIVRTLAPGLYTSILRGKGNSTGIGVVEIYDLGEAADSKLINISSRGFVGTGDNVLIGGFIVGAGGGDSSGIIARAIGPSLATRGVAGALSDPTLQLVDGNGVVVRANDDWKSEQQTELETRGLQPENAAEAALLERLTPGNYAAVVRGKNGGTGIALVEVYNVH